MPLLLLDTDVHGNDDAGRSVTERLYGGGGEHAPAAGDAARHGRRARAAALVAPHRRPDAGRLPHQRGPRRVPRRRADQRARARREHVLRRGARGRALRHRLHHAHPGARRHRPLRRLARSSCTSAAAQALEGVPVERLLAARRRELRGWLGRHVQHGRHGPAARAARQRRLAAARRGQPRRCSTVSGRASTTTRCRSPRSPTACTARPGSTARSSSWPAPTLEVHELDTQESLGGLRHRPRDAVWATKREMRAQLVDGGPAPHRASPGSSAAPRRPSSAGPTRSSTPTCSPSASPAGCRPTSGSP